MKISIPKPCSENWNEMTPEQQGAFCKVCSKVVVDFSSMSDEEVINYLEQKKGEKTCGRFRVSQLSPYELKINLRSVAAQKSFRKIFAASLFIFFSSLFVCKSDTGEPIVFNTMIADTASVTLRVDSFVNNINTDTSLATQTVNVIEPQLMVAGGLAIPPQIQIADTIIPKKDTVVIEPSPMLMGKMVCTKPNQVNKPKPVERKTKGEVRILGELKL